MKKVYVVIESSGTFDDYIRWINSVWESPEAAEKRRQEIIISEPDGIVRETMIANLLVGLQ